MHYSFEGHGEQETKLSLPYRDIDTVDSNIEKLKSLKYLNLMINNLEELPEAIGNLENLEIVALLHNRLSGLPDTIGNLRRLRKLFLSGNQLILLPETIGELKKLYCLMLSGNMLMQLSDTVGDLESLVELFLDGNELTMLPETIGMLRSLEYLNVRSNCLTILPSTIGHMESLRVLDLGGNQLTSLPDEMGMLRRLVYLNLRNNELTLLPSGMRRLGDSLALLSLEGNSISPNGDGSLGRDELRAVFGDRVVLDGDVTKVEHEIHVKDVYRKLKSKHVHWDFDEIRRLRPLESKSEHTEESLMEVWRRISDHTTEENRRVMEEFIHTLRNSSLFRNITGETLDILSGSSREVVVKTVEEICGGMKRCSRPAYVMVSVYHQLAEGPAEDYLRNVFETVIGCEKEMMFDAAISQDSFQRDLQMFWRHKLRDEVGLDSDGENVIDKYGAKALDRFRWPGNVLDVFYSMFTPKHVAGVLTELVNSRDRTVSEVLELLHSDPAIEHTHITDDGRTLVTEEQTRHLLARMNIITRRSVLQQYLGRVSSILRKIVTCDWHSSP